MIQCERFAGEFYIIANVRPFTNKLVRPDDKRRDVKWCDDSRHHVSQNRHADSDAEISDTPRANVRCRYGRSQQESSDDEGQTGDSDFVIDVADS